MPEPTEMSAALTDPYDLIEAELDGELDAAGRRRLERHLAADPELAMALEDARAIRNELGPLPELRCPPAVRTRVLARVQAESEKPGWLNFLRSLSPMPFLKPALATAALAALALGVFVGTDSRQPPVPSQADLEKAELELMIALAYLGRIGEKAGVAVRDGMVDNVLAPTHEALSAASSQ